MKKKDAFFLNETSANCITCNSVFVISTVLTKAFKIDVCSHCHPFYLGTQKFESKAGRMERFRQLERKTAMLLAKNNNNNNNPTPKPTTKAQGK